MRWIIRHFERYRERRPLDFCLRIGIESTLVGVAAAFLLDLLGTSRREMDIQFWTLLLAAVLIAPPVETLIFQAFPVWIARLFRARFSMQMLASVVPFALIHGLEGIQAFTAAGLIGGFYLAFTYVHWRERSRWKAFWITTIAHALGNGIVILLALAFGEISL